MNLFLTIASLWALLSLLLLPLSWYLIRTHYVDWHRRIMLILVAGGWIFVVAYLLNQFVFTPVRLPEEYLIWLIIHGSFSTIALAGSSVLSFARLKWDAGQYLNQNHKFYGRVFIVLWLFAHLGGLFNVYVLLANN